MSLVFNKVVSTDLDLQSQKSATDESNAFPCQDIRTDRATVTAEADSSGSVTAEAGSLGDISNISLHSALYHVLQRIAFTLSHSTLPCESFPQPGVLHKLLPRSLSKRMESPGTDCSEQLP